jgi:hypothetical protein
MFGGIALMLIAALIGEIAALIGEVYEEDCGFWGFDEHEGYYPN